MGGALHRPFNEPSLPATLLLTSPPPIAPRSERWRRLHAAWWKVVADYTQRSITSPADKLVACGAIAAEFVRVLSTKYLAGLWRDSLLNDLLWFKRPASANIPRPATYRAPSWSWAAVDEAVTKHIGEWANEEAAVAVVVQYGVILEDAALPFGQLTLVRCEWGPNRPYDGL